MSGWKEQQHCFQSSPANQLWRYCIFLCICRTNVAMCTIMAIKCVTHFWKTCIMYRLSGIVYQTKCIGYAVQVLSGIRHRVKVYAISAIRHQISCIRYPQLEDMFCVEKEGDASSSHHVV